MPGAAAKKEKKQAAQEIQGVHACDKLTNYQSICVNDVNTTA